MITTQLVPFSSLPLSYQTPPTLNDLENAPYLKIGKSLKRKRTKLGFATPSGYVSPDLISQRLQSAARKLALFETPFVLSAYSIQQNTPPYSSRTSLYSTPTSIFSPTRSPTIFFQPSYSPPPPPVPPRDTPTPPSPGTPPPLPYRYAELENINRGQYIQYDTPHGPVLSFPPAQWRNPTGYVTPPEPSTARLLKPKSTELVITQPDIAETLKSSLFKRRKRMKIGKKEVKELKKSATHFLSHKN